MIPLVVAFALAADPPEMKVVIQREKTADGLVYGTMTVDGKKLGPVYENDEKKVPAGTYPGVVRTTSMRNHAQGPGGAMGNAGDFVLEIAKGPGRSDILIHAGNKKEHSLGCVLCGPVGKNEAGERVAPDVLRQLRLAYFDGKYKPEKPVAKKITIEVRDPEKK